MTRRTLLLPLLLTALCMLAGASAARAQGGDHRAGLVIRYANGSVQTRCIAFSEPSITGAELLTRSGLQVTMDQGGMGGAVCSIAGEGCAFPTQDCFCHCQGLTCEYWAYYHWTDGWQYSQVGAGGYTLTDGALEGWSWGAGNFSSGVEPPLLTFAEVCPALATVTPTATVTTTPTATPASTTVASQADAAPPRVIFEAQPTELPSGTYTILRWWVSDMTQTTLDGASVGAQDQKQIRPPATQRFILGAANSAGQTVREITVTAAENPPVQAPIGPGSTAIRARTRRAHATPSPTPILLAYAQPAGASGTRLDDRTQSFGGDFAASESEVPNRDFSLALLPGYAAYLLTLASLVGAGVWVARRKASALRKS
jgi:hypothetical protein